MRDCINMGYETEKLVAELKAARERKGLSQRALSALAGVPQPHISKIESGVVNLTVSSLTAIANALDLELVLVPRKAVPAVRAVARDIGDVPKATPEVRKETARIARQIERLQTLKADDPVLESLQRRFRELRQFENLIRDTGTLRSIHDTLKAASKAGGGAALREALRKMTGLRDAIARGATGADRPSPPRPAYRLDGDDDE